VRIAAVNSFGQIVGGVERYLDSSIPLLADAGHEIHLWHEKEKMQSWRTRPTIRSASTVLPTGSLRHADLQIDTIARSMRAWMPDVVCVHSAVDPLLERRILEIAPAVYFAHAFAGTCISGSKTLHRPSPHPCDRTLGPRCLFHYYNERCGGLDPIRLLHDYSRNVEHLHNIRQYSAVIAFSSHIRAEYARHGVASEKLWLVPPFTPVDAEAFAPPKPERALGDTLVIGFAGRMIKEKGAHLLLDALPLVRNDLGKRIKLVIAGDGRERKRLERRALRISGRDNGIEIEFTKWAGRSELNEFYATLNLLVVPSVWPEPFGMVGLEAAVHGVPVAAFAVGGIIDWLRDGVNGHLARGDVPTVEGLAEAIIRCLCDRCHYECLCAGAIEVEAEYSAARHIGTLTGILESVQLQPA
jgi:glycosyltransferase involved in cell wall biosynthesis